MSEKSLPALLERSQSGVSDPMALSAPPNKCAGPPNYTGLHSIKLDLLFGWDRLEDRLAISISVAEQIGITIRLLTRGGGASKMPTPPPLVILRLM